MNWSDFTIIYLACGAPFAVYFYLNSARWNMTAIRRIFLSLVNFIFWLPLLIYLLIGKKFPDTFSESFFAESVEEKVRQTIKQFEKIFFEINPDSSIFEFREVLERYAGLTISLSHAAKETADRDEEIFLVSGKSRNDLSAICLNRRNRRRLYFHQNNARRDFLQLFGSMFASVSDKHLLENLAANFCQMLNDETAQFEIEKISAHRAHTETNFSVRNSEKDLWKPEIQKQPFVKQTSVPLQTLTTTLNSSAKD